MSRGETLNCKTWNLLKLQRYQVQDDVSEIRLGASSYESMKFRGTIYDYRCPPDEFLRTYAGQFDTVELPATFGGDFSSEDMEELRAQVQSVNKDFKFCPMIPRIISHENILGETPYDLQEFIEKIDLLGPHLGPVVLRLPETFSSTSLPILLKFLKKWPEDKRLNIHLTHGEWFKRWGTLDKVLEAIRGTAFGLVLEDRQELSTITERFLTSDHLMVRFFGSRGHWDDQQRLALWVYKLGEYRAYGMRQAYFYLHEQEEMCLSILQKVANSIGGRVRCPQKFDVNSVQMEFF